MAVFWVSVKVSDDVVIFCVELIVAVVITGRASKVIDPASLSFEPSTIDPASPFTINVPPVPVPIKENFKSKSRTYIYN